MRKFHWIVWASRHKFAMFIVFMPSTTQRKQYLKLKIRETLTEEVNRKRKRHD